MMVQKEAHLGILIGSLNKALKEARRKGRYSVRDLYFLNCIKKTLTFSCHIGMTEEDQKEIVNFYFRILSSSNSFYSHEFSSAYYKSEVASNSLFVQTGENTGTNAPVVSDFSIIAEGIFENTFDNIF